MNVLRFSYFIIAFLFWGNSFVGILELFDVINNPDDYHRVYHIGESSKHLQFKSLFNYKIWRLGQTGFCLIMGYFALMKGTRKKMPSTIVYPFHLALFLTIAWLLRYYILWVKSGFDHYPGFDPYLM
jgi:hypothetical protein